MAAVSLPIKRGKCGCYQPISINNTYASVLINQSDWSIQRNHNHRIKSLLQPYITRACHTKVMWHCHMPFSQWQRIFQMQVVLPFAKTYATASHPLWSDPGPLYSIKPTGMETMKIETASENIYHCSLLIHYQKKHIESNVKQVNLPNKNVIEKLLHAMKTLHYANFKLKVQNGVFRGKFILLSKATIQWSYWLDT